MSGVTNKGIRYPDGATKAKELGKELKTFAEDVDKYIAEHAKVGPRGPAGTNGTNGKDGARGPQGLPASETLPADEAVAAYIATEGNSATKTALSATIAAAVGLVEGHETGLRKWYAALADRYSAPTRILVMGDSNSEGTGATSTVRRWQNVLQAQMRGRFQPAGIPGAAISYSTAEPYTSPVPADYPVTKTGGQRFIAGLGARAWEFGGDGVQSMTYTFYGDQFQILYDTGSAVAGIMHIVVDGDAGTNVNTWKSGDATYGNVWTSPVLSRGAHTVVVTRSGGTTQRLFIEGFMAYDGDLSRGLRVIDGARHGAKVATFGGSTQWRSAVANTGPYGLCIMPWGANDSTGGTTPVQFRADLEDLIADLRGPAGFSGSILLVGMPKRGNATEEIWGQYRAQLEAIAAGDPDIAWFDLRGRMPDRGTAEAVALDLYADEVHYNDKGQGWIADQIATAIMPR